MRTTAVAPLLVAGAAALPELSVAKRDVHGRASPLARGMVRRDGTDETVVYDILAYSSGGAYYANVTVGTPPQDQVVILDTGSSDLYFDATSSTACQSSSSDPNGCRGGSYDPSKSSTYNEVEASPAFNTSFGDGSTAQGPYGSDIVSIGDVAISNVQFGVADEVSSTTGYAIGLMGVGYSLNEATSSASKDYPNMPEVLKNAGVIASRLYSLFLNDLAGISGSILFGGIDTSKYTGDLVAVNILPTDPSVFQQEGLQDPSEVYQFVTTVTGMTANIKGKSTTVFSGGVDGVAGYSDSNTLPVLLDSGSSAWSLDSSAYKNFIEPVFTFVDSNSTCSCKHQNDDISITLEFAGKIKITVPASEFIVPAYDPATNAPIPYTDGTETCLFMISPSPSTGQGFQTMGDAIMRSMYIVYDLDNAQMALAQANTNPGKSNIVKVPAGPNGIASAISSGYSSVASNTAATIAQAVSATVKYSASTLATPVGTATGTAAVPNDAQVTQIAATNSANSGTGSSSSHGSSSSSTSAGAAAASIPIFDKSGLYVSLIAACMAGIGAFAL
ncbi:Hypothetical protein R9X50_00422700 [Acrodontium crateriforme]|uniref:Peptidase A1 domain-containing protein n=1 Tax=Acrodontium crateriforme TaxID=150365 RepID=A0AAQ3MAN1_9PEZI|nr:Hypothetical protein R9X50_00422700 [Acrodontium crateriforme]